MSASAVLLKNIIEFVAVLHAGVNGLPFVEEEDNDCTVLENTCVAASKNGVMHFIPFQHLAPTNIWRAPFLSGSLWATFLWHYDRLTHRTEVPSQE